MIISEDNLAFQDTHSLISRIAVAANKHEGEAED